ncbi:hypothetical protein PZB75_09730 [Streptomyces sp. AM 4-1-1]|uniref:hypothetical protein n=1 Tax=Streptomyces sp. AM 4-1-1 TaxID=3028710 RepID=UPI0023B90404|nr:hypothetical protein [Streptomyces sp. AM 4-1-1]WEH33629.1 hypothetical protein PZB75_09730 [Streptomyces sp. AM 4-1-1]
MGFYELAVTAIGELRKRQGLTPDALAKQPLLLQLLDTDDEYEGVERLAALAHRLGDDQDAKMLRASLAIDVDRLKNTTARRSAARVDGTFYGSERSIFDAEKRAIDRLVKLLLKEAEQTDALDQEAAAEEEAETLEDKTPSPQPVERGLRRRHRLALLAIAVVSASLVVIQAWPDKSDKAADQKGSSAASPVAIPESDLDHTSRWGPVRKMYSVKSPAPYAAFNSLKDAYGFGDERGFLLCHDKREKQVDQRRWSNRIAAEDGHYYDCSAWFSNSVAPNLDKGNPAAQLHDARMEILVPENLPVYNPGLVAQFTADNAPDVWASCNFLAEKPLTIYYLPGSTFLTTRDTKKAHGGKGLRMADGAAHSSPGGIAEAGGALIGENKQDGIVRQASGWVQFTILIEFSNKFG